jgi:hypothetical protein
MSTLRTINGKPLWWGMPPLIAIDFMSDAERLYLLRCLKRRLRRLRRGRG